MRAHLDPFLRTTWWAAVAACLISMPLTSLAGDGSSLAEANRRWRGARCRSRLEITVKKGQDGDGWSKSEWIFRDEKKGNERVRVLVRGADSVRARYRGGTLPIGSEFVAVGWATDRPDGGDVYLELEVAGLGARARVYYYDDWVGRVSADRLDEFEQWARLVMFDVVESPSEQLVEPAAAATAPVAQPEAPAGAAPQPPPHAVGIRVLAASVDPSRVPPGGEVRLNVIYAIDGPTTLGEVEVDEQRVVLRDGVPLTTMQATARRTAGVHQSSQSLRLPASLELGLYDVEVRVTAAGHEAAGSTVFQVETPR